MSRCNQSGVCATTPDQAQDKNLGCVVVPSMGFAHRRTTSIVCCDCSVTDAMLGLGLRLGLALGLGVALALGLGLGLGLGLRLGI